MMSALFRSEFYTRMKRYWGENISVESFWGVLSCCLTPSILFNFRYEKIKTYMANLFTYFDGALPRLFTEMKVCWKAFFICNSYLSYVRFFFKIPSNFLSLISSYSLLKMLFSTLSFLWTTAVGPRQNM
jgi:hypothetical protein